MRLCDQCRSELAHDGENVGQRLPIYTITGGSLSTLGAVITGTIVLIPIGLLAGTLADTQGHRCDRCGKELEESEDSYQLMTEHEDSCGGKVYRPVSVSEETSSSASCHESPAASPLPHECSQCDESTLPSALEQGQNALHDSHEEHVFGDVRTALGPDAATPGEHVFGLDLPPGLKDRDGPGFAIPELPEFGDTGLGPLADAGRRAFDGIAELLGKLVPEDPPL